MMISSITHDCIPAIVCSQYTWLVNKNRMCCYRSSHTFLITDLFAAYHTHLVILNRFCSLVSTQTVHPSEQHVVCYLLSLCWFSIEEERVMQQSSVSISLRFENQGINPVGDYATSHRIPAQINTNLQPTPQRGCQSFYGYSQSEI